MFGDARALTVRRRWRVVPTLATLSMLAGAVACSSQSGNPMEGAATTLPPSTPQQLIVAEFAEQADLHDIAGIGDWAERGSTLVDRLQATADSSQREAREMVEAAGVEATTYWITNVMMFKGDDALAERVRRLPGVAQVYLEPLHSMSQPSFKPVTDVSAVPWNIDAMGAPQSWAEGRTGAGAVIGVVDSGVDVQHPALASAWLPTGGWFDATGECPEGPCDPVGHGTHVAGIAVGGGGDGGPSIGAAPGATFIAAKACSPDGCLENDLLEAAQWMLAPDGRPGDRPAILVNSWTLASSDTSLDTMPDVWRAAGQVPVFAAGNEGPGCGTIGGPAGQPGALAVGSLRRDGSVDPVSSRGAQGATPPKPDLWAPGVEVVSSLPGGGYGLGSGTSMAAPHIAGALALLLGDSKDIDSAIHDLAAAPAPSNASCGR